MAKSRASFTVTRTPSPNIYYREYREEIRKDFNKLGDAHVNSRKRVVSNWSNRTKPTFSHKVTVNLFVIGIQIMVREKSRKRPIWHWLDVTGIKAHVIRPKPGNKWGRLFFPWGGPGSYQAKTKAGPARWGGSGLVRGAKLTVAKMVKHPGFKPRKFSEAINKDLRPEARRAIKNGGARGLRRARKKDR